MDHTNSTQSTTPAAVQVSETGGVSRITAADLRPSTPGSVLSTVRTTGSGARPAVIGPEHIVTAGGQDMHVKTAVAQGYLRMTEAGGYADATPPEAATEETSADDTAPESEAVPFAVETEAELTEFAHAVPGAFQDQLIHSVITGKTIDAGMASAIGMDPQIFSAGIEHAHAAFVHQASAAVQKLGADPAEFYAWATENAGEAFQSAKRQHVHSRNPAAYSGLVERYLRAVPPDGETLAKAGLPVTNTKAGEELITINGMTTTRQVAARLGWI